MTGLAAAIFAVLSPLAMAVGTANSAPIPISLPVSSVACSVANDNPSITLPSAEVGQTLASYQAANLPVINGTVAAPQWATSTTLHQVATISCNSPNTPILSVLVKPGPSATIVATAEQYLVDATTPTPVLLGGAGVFPVYAEQVSINGSPAGFVYAEFPGSKTLAYTTSFSTGQFAPGTSVSKATVGWRPTFFVGLVAQNKFLAPQGGSYNGSFQIVVNY